MESMDTRESRSLPKQQQQRQSQQQQRQSQQQLRQSQQQLVKQEQLHQDQQKLQQQSQLKTKRGENSSRSLVGAPSLHMAQLLNLAGELIYPL